MPLQWSRLAASPFLSLSMPATRSRPGLEKYFPPGPWTDKHEEWFQIMTKEFGGAPERDPDL